MTARLSAPAARVLRATLAVLSLLAAPAAAQQSPGKVVGRVIDGTSGAPLPDVGIQIVGTTLGASSGPDGRFAIYNVPAGTVTIHARRIGFAPKTVTGLVLAAGGALEQDISLFAASVQLTPQVVTAAAERGSVRRALDEQRNATAILSSTTSEQIARSPDANAAQAVQRVSGVTIQDGKYVFVRGLGERYTTTALNGARMPSPEPERRVVPLDLFPSALIEGITTSKTFTPDQPGDFSGAAVNIRTREFPGRRLLSVSTSMGFNSAATGRSILSAPTLGTEWIGFAGTDRALPASLAGRGTAGLSPGTETNEAIRSFRNAWSARRATGAPSTSFGMSFGGSDPVAGHPVGYVGSLTYAYSEDVRRNEQRNTPRSDGQGGAVALNTLSGSTGRAGVVWGGLLNLNTQLGSFGKLTSSNTYNRTADNTAREYVGLDEQFATEVRRTRLSFVERSVLANQLRGDHVLGSRHNVDWLLSRAQVKRDEPDRSDLTYWREEGGFAWRGSANDATRSFSTLDETDLSAALNYRLSLGGVEAQRFVKIGAMTRDVSRNAATRTYDIVNQRLDFPERNQQAETLFGTAYTAGADTNFLLTTSTFGGIYTAKDRVLAGYGLVDVPFASRLRLVTGARVEQADLRVLSLAPNGGPAVPAAIRSTDVLPSLALTYALTDQQNLRFSASQTLSRPEYRELSSLCYSSDEEDLVCGNPALQRALIRNVDVRWEWYPAAEEVLSVSVFAKEFDRPIERIYRSTTGAPTIGFANAQGARNYGVELDARASLRPLGSWADALSAFANLTVMQSRIALQDATSTATNPKRAMVGQAPYVVNTGLNYAAGRSVNATLLYNLVGERIVIAGLLPLPDTYERPRHLLDLSLQFPVRGSVTGKLTAKNLLDAPYVEQTGAFVRRRYETGRSFALGFGWTP